MIPDFHTPSQAAPLIYFRGSHEVARLSANVLSRCFELAPTWIGWNSKQLDQSKAETAVLKDVKLSTTALRCYLMIEHEGEEYLGALLFEDHNSCLRIYRLLLSHRGEMIRKVSEIDVPHSSTTAPIKPKTCKMCGSIDNCDFKVMDDMWRTTIPIEYRNDIVCGKCFENFAAERQIQLLRRKDV